MVCEYCPAQVAKDMELEANDIAKCDNCGEQWRVSQVADESELFILCKAPECFPEHKLVKRAERVNICESLDQIGAVNWD